MNVISILIVEDDSSQSDSLSNELKKSFENIKVEIIETESDFITNFPTLLENTPDIIIMDLMLRWATEHSKIKKIPKSIREHDFYSAGFRCLKLLKSNPKTGVIPVIIHSTNENEDVKVTIKNTPKNWRIIQKSSNRENLLLSIRSLLPNALTLSNENFKSINTKETETKMDIFISHSSQDSDTAKLLIDLLKTSLNLSSSKIKCTSINGYRLPAGASTNDILKKEVHESKVLIGLISPNSINSAYVLFELGARWGASLPLIPLITSELGSELLKGPLGGINALNCCEPAQLQQLISDLKTELKVTGESPEVYQGKIELLVNHSLKELLPTNKVIKTSNKSTNQKSNNFSKKNDDKIKSYCEKQWPNDYSMRVHCIKEQREAKQDIENSKPLDIPEDIFNRILEKAVSEWPTDFTMQVHSRNEQVDAYLELNDL